MKRLPHRVAVCLTAIGRRAVVGNHPVAAQTVALQDRRM